MSKPVGAIEGGKGGIYGDVACRGKECEEIKNGDAEPKEQTCGVVDVDERITEVDDIFPNGLLADATP